MIKIGIIGAENSHTVAIAKTINIDRSVKGCSVDYVWGETSEFAKTAAQNGHIPNMVADQKQMLGKIDALIVTHRHAKFHLKAALPFIKKGIPAFIDKPFCYRLSEGRDFLKLAKHLKTPVTSFSVLPEQKDFEKFEKKLAGCGKILAASTYGPCDLKSKYGGVFFYGIHQVDMALKAFGYNVVSVLTVSNGNGAAGQLLYSDGKIVTMNFIKEGFHGFQISAIGTEKSVSQPIEFDKNPFIAGVKKFTNMFKTGNMPEDFEHMLKPIQILESLEISLKSKETEKLK